MAPPLTAAAVQLAALLALIGVVRGGVVAVAELKSCVNDGSSPTTALSCAQQIVATVTVENDRLYETERLEFAVSCVNSPTGECPCPCDYASDPSCECRDLRQAISVAATKTPVYASYPLTYRQSFNGRPYEDIVYGTTCSDGALAEAPTCGWAVSDGYRIPHSQGFCCNCAGISSTDLPRGPALQCSRWIPDAIDGTSAHCMRLDDSWWHAGYEIGEFQLSFRIALNITTTTATAPAPVNATSGGASDGASTSAPDVSTEVLALTPSQPHVRDTGRRVAAKLLGDLAGYQQEAQLDGKWLMIPFALDEGAQVYLSERRHEWMVVDPTQVTTSGTECNKIGVSYDAFRNAQGLNACKAQRDSCLANQLHHFYFADRAAMEAGKEPQYLIGRYGGSTAEFEHPDQLTLEDEAGGSPRLSLNLPLRSIRTSLLSLSVAADNVTFVVNRSPAQIAAVEVCTFDGKICGGFEALSTRGYLHVDVRNSGYVAAQYTVGVAQCSAGVMPLLAQTASVAPQSTQRFSFELRMETDQATNSSCSVSVVDSLGDVAATQRFSFYTNATQYERPPEQSDLDDQVPPQGGPNRDWCQRVCPSVFDFKCAATRGCFGRLTQGVAAIVAPLAWLALMAYAWRQGYLSLAWKLISIIFCSSGASQAAAPAEQQRRKRGDGGTRHAGATGDTRRRRWWQRRRSSSSGRELEAPPAPAAGAAVPPAQLSIATKAPPVGWQQEPATKAPPSPDSHKTSASAAGGSVSTASGSLEATIVAVAAQQVRQMLSGLGELAATPSAPLGAPCSSPAEMTAHVEQSTASAPPQLMAQMVAHAWPPAAAVPAVLPASTLATALSLPAAAEAYRSLGASPVLDLPLAPSPAAVPAALAASSPAAVPAALAASSPAAVPARAAAVAATSTPCPASPAASGVQASAPASPAAARSTTLAAVEAQLRRVREQRQRLQQQQQEAGGSPAAG